MDETDPTSTANEIPEPNIDDTNPTPAASEKPKPSEEDIQFVEEARKILFEEGYIPQVIKDRPGAVFNEHQRGHYAINNFPLYLSGQYLRSMLNRPEAEQETLKAIGRTPEKLFADIDDEIERQGLDPERIATLQEGGAVAYTDLCRYLFPVIESLVLEQGYPAAWLKG